MAIWLLIHPQGNNTFCVSGEVIVMTFDISAELLCIKNIIKVPLNVMARETLLCFMGVGRNYSESVKGIVAGTDAVVKQKSASDCHYNVSIVSSERAQRREN